MRFPNRGMWGKQKDMLIRCLASVAGVRTTFNAVDLCFSLPRKPYLPDPARFRVRAPLANSVANNDIFSFQSNYTFVISCMKWFVIGGD